MLAENTSLLEARFKRRFDGGQKVIAMTQRHIYEIRMEEAENMWNIVVRDQGRVTATFSVKQEPELHFVKEESFFSDIVGFIKSICEAIEEGDILRLSQLCTQWSIARIAVKDGADNNRLPCP